MTWNNPAWEGDEWAAVRAAYYHEEDLVAIEWRRAWATRLAYARQARRACQAPPANAEDPGAIRHAGECTP